MSENVKVKRKFEFPHVLVLLVTLVIIATVMTYIVPAGTYDRVKDESNGYTVVVADSYQQVAQKPVSFLDVPGILFQSFVKAADIIAFVFIVGGAFTIVMATGAVESFCVTAARASAGKEKILLIGLMFIFSVFGFTFGMSTEGVAFIPMAIALCSAMGYDRMTAVSLVTVGALAGYASGIVNPFNVGIAQVLAELPMFSGLGYRIVAFIVLFGIASAFTVRYANKVKADPTCSVMYGESSYEADQNAVSVNTEANLTGRHKAVLIVVMIGFAVLIWGALARGWWLTEMAGLFLTMGVVAGIVGGLRVNKLAQEFVVGARMVVEGCLMIGFARGIQTVMDTGLIIDTVVHSMTALVALLPATLQAMGIYIVQSLLNVPMTSSNVQVVVTMPILIPVADLTGVSRQATVMAFALGDGISNIVLPTWGTLMSTLAIAKIPYQKWVRYVWPMFVAWVLGGCLLMIVSTLIGY